MLCCPQKGTAATRETRARRSPRSGRR
jgi:hypothetical protein